MITRRLANFVSETSFDKFHPEVVAKAKDCIMDWLGCCLAGSREEATGLITNTMLKIGGDCGIAQATVLGRGIKSPLINAAFINAAAGNLLDLDDIYPPMIGHPSSSLVPALLAVGEWKKCSGKDLITAYVVGYEIEVRVGKSITPNHYERGWHTTSTVGHFASAATTAKLLNLDIDQIVYAFAMAGTQACGLRQLFGTPSKCIHQARAASNGILAAYLAREGMVSSREIIEGEKGFCRVFADSYDSECFGDIGTNYEILKIGFKRHASCGTTHTAIDAALQMREETRLNPGYIDTIEITVNPLAIDLSSNMNPKNGFEGKYSLAFCVALALTEGSASLNLFSDEKIKDPLIRELMLKTRLKADPSMKYIEAAPALVSLKMKDGSVVNARVDVPLGRVSNPMPREELQNKFYHLATGTLTSEKAEEVVKMISNLEEIDDIAMMIEVCG